MVVFAIWKTNRSTITSAIHGVNYRINLSIEDEAKDFDFVVADKTDAFQPGFIFWRGEWNY